MENEKRDKQRVLLIDDRRDNIIFLANYILKPKGYTSSQLWTGKGVCARHWRRSQT